jgi:hypothetical protein
VNSVAANLCKVAQLFEYRLNPAQKFIGDELHAETGYKFNLINYKNGAS